MAVFSKVQRFTKVVEERVPLTRDQLLSDVTAHVVEARTARATALRNTLRAPAQGYYSGTDREIASDLLGIVLAEPGNTLESADREMTRDRMAGLEAGIRRLRELLA